MKNIIIALITTFSLNAQAQITHPEQMPQEQKEQLIHVLNQMEPEMLSHILSEEALQWYIEQFSRDSRSYEEVQEDYAHFGHSRLPYDGNPYKDDNAPSFQ